MDTSLLSEYKVVTKFMESDPVKIEKAVNERISNLIKIEVERDLQLQAK